MFGMRIVPGHDGTKRLHRPFSAPVLTWKVVDGNTIRHPGELIDVVEEFLNAGHVRPEGSGGAPWGVHFSVVGPWLGLDIDRAAHDHRGWKCLVLDDGGPAMSVNCFWRLVSGFRAKG